MMCVIDIILDKTFSYEQISNALSHTLKANRVIIGERGKEWNDYHKDDEIVCGVLVTEGEFPTILEVEILSFFVQEQSIDISDIQIVTELCQYLHCRALTRDPNHIDLGDTYIYLLIDPPQQPLLLQVNSDDFEETYSFNIDKYL